MPTDHERLERVSTMTPRVRGRQDLVAFTRRLGQLGVLIAVLLATGTIGFVLTTDHGPWNSFVLALDTVATVGSIPAPTSTAAEIVKVLLIVFGVGTLFYALVTVAEFFVAGHLGEILVERRTQKEIDSLSDHYIICGFGRVGRQVARDLKVAGASYVVVDSNPESRELTAAVGVRFLEGPPSDDELLRAAGIDRARGLIACMDSDAENIFATLTAREMRGDIAIIARAAAEDSEKKLKRAGADRVISPYKSSGTEMARLALHPQVSGTQQVNTEYRMEEIEVGAGCAGAGQTVGEVRGGSFIVGVRHADGSFLPMPAAETTLGPGDVVMALGTPNTLDRLEALFVTARPAAV
ncbi:MAG: voltage-gated potassium channel [Solirubrobacteraceae bacterium]|jgi:voltage-gated potassium channel|nr:voltage-gated potassium channel [Solirubrobacteraceae bacterium]